LNLPEKPDKKRESTIKARCEYRAQNRISTGCFVRLREQFPLGSPLSASSLTQLFGQGAIPGTTIYENEFR